MNAPPSPRSVLVLGGSSGIGRGIAEGLLASGARVAIVSRRPPREWPGGPPPAFDAAAGWLRADLADAASAAALLDAWLSRRENAPDALILAAGSYGAPGRRPLADTTPQEWDELFAVNARASFVALRTALPHLLRRPRALIVDIRSDVAYAPGPGRAAYAAAKAASRALMDAAAAELAQTGVSLVGLLPARQVATPGLARRREPGFDFSGYLHPAAFAAPAVHLVNTLGAGLHGQCLSVG